MRNVWLLFLRIRSGFGPYWLNNTYAQITRWVGKNGFNL